MERKEPTLDGFSLADNAVEEPSVKAPSSPVQPTATSRSNSQRAKSTPPPVYQPKSSGGWVGPLALLIAVAATVGSGYLAWQLQLAQQRQVNAEARLSELESRLNFSDEESSQSVEAIRAKLKWADSEIRKLWGVSYDTNRKAIAENKKALAKLKKTVASAATNASQAKKLASGHAAEIDSLKKVSSADSARLEEALATLETQRKRLQEAADKANAANSELARLRNELDSRVKNNEEAVAAIDAYRVRINREINELKQKAGLL